MSRPAPAADGSRVARRSLGADLSASARLLAPGVALSAAVAIAAVLLEPAVASLVRTATGASYTLPAIVIALLIGIALNGMASRPVLQPGITTCVKTLLRIAIGLLGLRIAFGDIVDLGVLTALIVVVSMVATLASGMWFAMLLGLAPGYGALAGAANAVCGASATLAASTVVPHYKEKEADVVFAVVAANAVSTVVMIAYPPLCLALGLDAQDTGVMLGATIHDMAQVVGAGYAVSEPVGNTALVVKLFRVLLLLPVVLGLGWWFWSRGEAAGEARVPVPVFALVFIGLAGVNSMMLALPQFAGIYAPIKAALSEASRWGLLIAIAALGLGTSVSALLRIGWRHVAVFLGATLVILVIATAAIVVAA